MVLFLSGFDRAPRSIGARLLSVFWFVFVSITLITYTGAIVNNLFWASTVHSSGRNTLPFRDLEELAMHPDYKVSRLLKLFYILIFTTKQITTRKSRYWTTGVVLEKMVRHDLVSSLVVLLNTSCHVVNFVVTGSTVNSWKDNIRTPHKEIPAMGWLIYLSLQWRHNGRLKSPASRLFTQPFIQAEIRENIKAPRH